MQVLKEQTEGDKLNEARLARCVPIAKQVMSILEAHSAEIVIGDNAACEKSLKGTIEEVLILFLKENINFVDRQFVFQLALQPFDHLVSSVKNSTEISFDKANSKVWGKDILDIKFSDIDEVLKRAENDEAKAE